MDDKHPVRTLFVIAPNKQIKLMLTYPLSCGRNFTELLRTIDALQLAEQYNVATPAGWVNGDEVIISLAIKDQQIPSLFPKGARHVKPYLRFTAQPDR
jgi:alkyl hydroperoxide reductase subunit AhpC